MLREAGAGEVGVCRATPAAAAPPVRPTIIAIAHTTIALMDELGVGDGAPEYVRFVDMVYPPHH